MSFEVLADKKDDVLNETIAQGILQELTDLRGLGGNHNKRWGIELVQNALDASKDQGVDVRIRVEDRKLVFSHNGRTFTEEELIHLIYHGSTKVEAESTSGKLGTGFLATHLLSPCIQVTGTLQDTQKFTFSLDRDAQTLDQLTGKMKDTWRMLETSLRSLDGSTEPDTIFEYSITNDEAKKICQEGIAALKETIPIVLAFDRRLGSVTIDEGTDVYVWKRGELSDSLMPIELTRNGESIISQICCVVVMRQDDVTVGLPLCFDGSKYAVADISQLPKLYYPLPLFGTTILPFPALISSLNFMPTKDREGVLLTDKTEGHVETNKNVIKIAFTILNNILHYVSERKYDNLFNIARIPKPNSFPNWLSEGWIEPFVVSLILKLRDAKLVSVGDSMISPKDSHVPITTEADVKAVWELSSLVYPKSTPNETESRVWREILAGWARHLYPTGSDAAKLEEGLTIEKLVQSVEGYGKVRDLHSVLGEKSVSDFINKLVELILKTKKNSLLEDNRILPDQNGIFRVKKDLSRDPGISEELKNIMSLLGRDLRAELLSKDIIIDVINFRTEEEVMLDALNRIKDQAKTHYDKDNYQQANLKLLQWLISSEKLEEIREAYPVITRRKDLSEEDYVQFFSQETRFLVPENTWSEEDRKCIDVFPSRAVLSNIYDGLTKDHWKSLSEAGLVLQDLSFKESFQLDGKHIRVLSVDEIKEGDKIDHKSREKVPVTSIPFLEEKDWGIIDRVRGSQQMASKFLAFVLGNLVMKDSSWREPLMIACECGSSHQIYPSLWLKTLCTRQWIPISGGGEEKPSSENLVPFFTNSELMNMLRNDPNVSHFLGILGINVSVLMTANKSKVDQREIDRAFSSFLAAIDVDPKQLSKLAEACTDPNLRKKLFDALAEKQLVQANRRIGELVEKIIREKLGEKLPKDTYKVDKVTAGSDARITVTAADVETTNDIVDEAGKELFVRISDTVKEHLVEIKSTREQSVRLTIPQAKQAHKATTAFTLCVVEVPANIADITDEQAESIVLQKARFVSPIGDKLGEMLNEIDAFQNGEKALHFHQKQGMQVDVISDAKIRIKVNRPVWVNGLDFTTFVELIGGVHPGPNADPVLAEVVPVAEQLAPERKTS